MQPVSLGDATMADQSASLPNALTPDGPLYTPMETDQASAEGSPDPEASALPSALTRDADEDEDGAAYQQEQSDSDAAVAMDEDSDEDSPPPMAPGRKRSSRPSREDDKVDFANMGEYEAELYGLRRSVRRFFLSMVERCLELSHRAALASLVLPWSVASPYLDMLC